MAGRIEGAPENGRCPSVAGARQFRAFAGAAPALPARTRHPGGVGAPPGDTTVPRQELADRRKCRKARPDAVRKTPQQGAERRAGSRHEPVISGASGDGPVARQVEGCGVPHQRLSALCSPLLFRERKRTKGIRRPHRTGRRSFAKNPNRNAIMRLHQNRRSWTVIARAGAADSEFPRALGSSF